MKITEILERAGDGLKTQRLDESFAGMRQKKEHSEITFCTTHAMAQQMAKSALNGERQDYVGIVVWIPKAAFEPNNSAQTAGHPAKGDK